MKKKTTKEITKSSIDGKFTSPVNADKQTTVTQTVATNKLTDAVETLKNALRDDADFYYAYQSNIAMAFYDTAIEQNYAETNVHILATVANDAAKRFLNLLLDESERPDFIEKNVERNKIINE